MKAYKNAEALILQTTLARSSLAGFSDVLMALYEQGWEQILTHGDLRRWQDGFELLPDVIPCAVD